MRLALEEAQRAADTGEVPVGAVLIDDAGQVVARNHNQRETQQDPTAHAEMLVLREGAQRRGSWRLTGYTLVVTLEPCAMCAGAIVLARIDRLVFGAWDPKAGAVESLYHLVTDPRLNHRVEVVPGVLAETGGMLLKEFFRARRHK
ncbi:cytidine and deoxycytidylate deaminase [Sulfobacillus acidophilus TPY]|nr:cytidine and deoxycytidylate deaminase [Sulfobacillus acidophilus TPY]